MWQAYMKLWIHILRWHTWDSTIGVLQTLPTRSGLTTQSRLHHPHNSLPALIAHMCATLHADKYFNGCSNTRNVG